MSVEFNFHGPTRYRSASYKQGFFPELALVWGRNIASTEPGGREVLRMRELAMPLPLKMVRWDLENLPEFALPPGYRLRWYRPGDEEAWMGIHLQADQFTVITPELFAEQFGSERAQLSERQAYLLASGGEVIGTGTAWFNDDFQGRRFGRIHWVALLPQWQGRGLSKPLMTVLCRRLRELGHDCAYLSTSPKRLRAIRLYRRFGFVPLIENAEQEAVWRGLGS